MQKDPKLPIIFNPDADPYVPKTILHSNRNIQNFFENQLREGSLQNSFQHMNFDLNKVQNNCTYNGINYFIKSPSEMYSNWIQNNSYNERNNYILDEIRELKEKKQSDNKEKQAINLVNDLDRSQKS